MNYLSIPNTNNSFYDETLRFELDENLIFVFGSNEAGRHGKGAAKHAVEFYGARYGVGFGLRGQSFAIPTKDRNLQVLPLAKIARYVDEFKKDMKPTSSFHFFVTAIGTGLARYEHKDIAPLFKGCHNCWFPQAWAPYLS